MKEIKPGRVEDYVPGKMLLPVARDAVSPPHYLVLNLDGPSGLEEMRRRALLTDRIRAPFQDYIPSEERSIEDYVPVLKISTIQNAKSESRRQYLLQLVAIGVGAAVGATLGGITSQRCSNKDEEFSIRIKGAK